MANHMLTKTSMAVYSDKLMKEILQVKSGDVFSTIAIFISMKGSVGPAGRYTRVESLRNGDFGLTSITIASEKTNYSETPLLRNRF